MVRNKSCILISDGEGFKQQQIISSTCISEKEHLVPKFWPNYNVSGTYYNLNF